MKPVIRQIAIIGMGLIGGSLGLAIKAAQGTAVEVIGIDTNRDSLAKAKQIGAADTVGSDYEAICNADMVFMCTPVLQIAAIIKETAPFLKQGAVLTDAGSTKTFLMKEIAAVLPNGVHYVPGHPMAGREKSGIEAADAGLFLNRWYILTPVQDTDIQAVEAVRQVISWTGAKITEMDAAEHDWCTAIISHVPHVGAAALVNLLKYSKDQDSSIKLAGGGFRDTTRIASSNADMWADICLTNAECIADSLDKFSQIIGEVAANIRKGDRSSIHHFFSVAKERRDHLLQLEQQVNE